MHFFFSLPVSLKNKYIFQFSGLFIWNDIVKNQSDSTKRSKSNSHDTWLLDNYRRRPYMTFRIHFCKRFEITVLSLKTEIFHHPHTALRISQSTAATLAEFNLTGKKILAVSDNGANVVAGLRLANIGRISCAAHNLHLFISTDIIEQQFFAPLATIIKKLKNIYLQCVDV